MSRRHVSKFYLRVPELEDSGTANIIPWIDYLSRFSVKEITIKNVADQPTKLSYHLFSCPKLEMLVIDNCILNMLPSYKVLRNLKSVELERVVFVGKSLTDFIAKCPALQSLTLTNCQGCKNIYITASNLKYLTICGNFECVYLTSAGNLVGFSITLEGTVPDYRTARTLELIAYLANCCRIEHLSLSGHFCKLLTAGRTGETFQTSYRYLTSLQLSNIETNVQKQFLLLVGMINSCPNVEHLKISFASKCCNEHEIAFDPCYRLSRLRKVDLTSVMGVMMELRLIEFLLCASPVLEIMCVKRHEKITKVLESRLSRMLMRFRRVSPKATIDYVEP